MALGDLIHQHVHAAVEQAVHEELAAVLGVGLYERSEARRGRRNGSKTRTLTGPTGPLEQTLPRTALFTSSGPREWASKLRPRSQRRRAEEQLLALETCGSEWNEAWKGCLDDLVERGLKAPLLCIVDGNAGLRRALSLVWGKTPVQRCCVHKLRNLVRKAPKHTREEIADDFHRIVYAASEGAAREAYGAFTRKWKSRCPGVVRSLEEAGDELLTMYRFPKQQWKTIRTTNVIERLNGEFRRRVKTQGSLPSEDSALILLFSLVATGQIKLRKLDGYKRLAGVINAQLRKAA